MDINITLMYFTHEFNINTVSRNQRYVCVCMDTKEITHQRTVSSDYVTSSYVTLKKVTNYDLFHFRNPQIKGQ